MTPIQLILLFLLAVIGISMIVAISIVASAYVRYRKSKQAERSLLERLKVIHPDNQKPPRRKFSLLSSRVRE